MKETIQKEFTISEPIEKVWEYLSDPTKIVGCVPGATLTEKIDDKNYKGQVTTSFGPVKASYNGTIEIVELDSSLHKMTLSGKGVDAKGKGSADMIMNGSLIKKDTDTAVKFIMEISVVGMLAQFGSRLIKDVSDQLLNKFADNFKSLLAGKEVDSKMSATSMMGSIMKNKIGGLFEGKKEDDKDN